MGVVNRIEPNCEIAKSPETVHITDLLIIPAPNTQDFVTFNFMDLVPPASFALNNLPSPRRRLGRRRQRRVSAEAELSALTKTEKPEEFLCDGIPHNSPFRTLMESSEYSTILEKFIGGDQIEQDKLLGLQSVGRPSSSKLNSESYAKVSPKIKLALKTTRNLYQLQKLEDEIVDFLTRHPKDYYLNNNASKFQRLLIHGIAQYYDLKSHSFDIDVGKRVIKVGNPNFCSFTEKRLYAVVKKNYGKKSNY